MSFINLEHLIELKLVFGMVPGRLKDLADVQELIRTLDLPRDLALKLNPFVQPSYEKLWDEARQAPPQP